MAIPAERNVNAKGSRKETKIQEFMYGDTTNVEHEKYHHSSNNASHGNGAITRKHSIDSLQKTAILVASHIIRKVLQCEA